MGAHKVRGGKRLRWRVEEDRWHLIYEGRPAAEVRREVGGGATLRLIAHPRLPAPEFRHWFESVSTAKTVALGAVQRQIERVLRGV